MSVNGISLSNIRVKKQCHCARVTATEGHFQCRSNTGDIFKATEIRSMQYLKSHYHEQTPFLSLNYKSVNGLIYLLCPWPIFEEKCVHFSRDIDILTVF